MSAIPNRRATPGVRNAPIGNYTARLCALYIEERRAKREAFQLGFFLGLGLGCCGAVLAVWLALYLRG